MTHQDLNESLFSAACMGDSRKLEKLLDQGADPNFRAESGNTALHSAYQWGQLESVKKLINRGADVNLGDKYHRTLLALASERGDFDFVRFLISKGGDVNTNDARFFATPLIRAAARGRREIVSLLLANGADPDLHDCMGETALLKAEKWGKHNVTKVLQAHKKNNIPLANNLVPSDVIGSRNGKSSFPGPTIHMLYTRFKNEESDDGKGKDLKGIQKRGEQLLEKLTNTPRGREAASDYEDLCLKILLFCFEPHLKDPDTQMVSEDKLDRMDAIFTIMGGHPFWDSIRVDFRSRLLVAEFKNRSDVTSQKEVESIEQYLHSQAFRMFGILMTRTSPSESATNARRRAYNASGKMIVLIDDEETAKLIQCRMDGKDPTDILNKQIDDFLRKLTP